MSHELAFFLKVNIAIALFYAFYRLFFYKDTFFKWRRIVLLCFFGISLLYPLLNIQDWIKEQQPMVAMADLYSTVILPEISIDLSPDSPETDWKRLIISSLNYIYIGVLGLLLIRFFIQLISIIRLGIETPTMQIKDTNVHILNKPQGPFSFFRWIFIHPDAHTEEELEEILIHEKTHAAQWHSIDVVFSELMCIICWFNPFAWLMKREVRNNLEFMADHKVLETGHDCKTYQYHLLGLAHQKSVATLYNSFNVLPLKIRIRMMNKKRTKQIGRTKYLIFLPLAALLLIVSNIEAIARSTERLIDRVIQPEYTPVLVEEAQESNLTVPETIPEFVRETNRINEINTIPEAPVTPPVTQQEKKYRYKGVVVDKNDKPVKDVQVFVDDRSVPLMTTNEKGEFSLESGNEAVILFNYEANGKSMAMALRLNSDSPDRENIKAIMDVDKLISIQYTPEPVNESDDNTPVFEVVEQMPEFPGGNKAMMEFLRSNIKYPAEAAAKKEQGRVIAQFIVDKEGNITNPILVRSVSPELDAEALRIISVMPKWKPGMQRGKAVSVKYTVPISFNLNNEVKQELPISETLPNGEVIYNKPDQMPEFPDGVKGLMDYLSKNIKYPAQSKQDSTQGRVVVQFIVDKEGNIQNPVVMRNVDPLLDQEALRVVSAMPKWKPGKHNGEAVVSKYTVPIAFRL